ncbi:MAG: DUF1802 family protein [Phycisphaeraceae bacterium]|nr:DUF1802 family protein [Phycisphaeraceae bacterium]
MLNVALKEWAVICDLLLEGSYGLLLRKGGIHEPSGPGRFELEYPRFALFPSWAHQQPAMIKPPLQPRVQILAEPPSITFHAVAEAAGIWSLPNRACLEPLDDLHPYSPQQVDMRFNYKPDRPLFLLALRVFRLAKPQTIPNIQAYGGCRSWVPLAKEHTVDDAGATPVLTDKALADILARVQQAVG